MNSIPSNSLYDTAPLADALQSGAPVLTPNSRLALHIRESWGRAQAASGLHCWETPLVLSLEQWWQHCHEQVTLAGEALPAVASPQQELVLWQNIISAHPDSGGLLRPRGAAQLARDAWHNLRLWELDWHSEPLVSRFKYDQDAGLFREWALEFERTLEQRGLATLPALAPLLAGRHQVPEILLAEFNELPPLYERLLQEQGTVRHVHRQHPVGDRQLLACDTDRQELLRAGQWLAERLEEDPGCTVGVLVPDLERRRETVLQQLGEGMGHATGSDFGYRDLPLNISIGVPLLSCGPVRAALQLLALPMEDTPVATLVELLHSRYRNNGEFALEQELVQRLYRRGRAEVSASLLRRECSRIDTDDAEGLALGRQLLDIANRRELRRKHAPSTWARQFRHCLDTLGWPGFGPGSESGPKSNPGPNPQPAKPSLDSVEYRQVEHFHRTLEQLGELDPVCGPLDYRAALQLLRQSCMDSVFPPRTGDHRVQVLGLLEARGLTFSHLWICGMSNAQWPPSASSNPFIPGAVQAEHHLPHANAERELDYARTLLQNICDSGANIVASYVRQMEDIPLQPSPLLEDFRQVEMPGDTPLWPQVWSAALNDAQLEELPDDEAPPVDRAESETLGGGSGVLTDQSLCPFRAFARHRLGAKPLDGLETALSAAERGSILHDALFQLWQGIGDSAQLGQLDGDSQRERVQRAVAEAVSRYRERHPQARMQALLDLESSRLETLLSAWLDIERQRPGFEVLGLEQEQVVEVNGLSLRLYLDRVDRLADGCVLLMDYKSGSNETSHWMSERPSQPQLPLYALALEEQGENVAAIAFAQINGRDLAFKGIGGREEVSGISADINKKAAVYWDGPMEGWEQLKGRWREDLERLAGAFLGGGAEVDPVDGACDYCGLEALCRIQ